MLMLDCTSTQAVWPSGGLNASDHQLSQLATDQAALVLVVQASHSQWVAAAAAAAAGAAADLASAGVVRV